MNRKAMKMLSLAAGILLTAVMLCLLPQTAQAKVLGSGNVNASVKWNVEQVSETETVLTISGTGNMEDYGISLYTPWYSWRDQITKVVIGDGVKSAGKEAFGDMKSLTSVVLPKSSLTKISERAFSYCRSLQSVQIPVTVKEIGASAFYECNSLESANIPVGIRKIENATFMYSSLQSITIPAGVTEIGTNAFAECKSLEKVTMPTSATVFGDDCFKKTPWLESLGEFAIVNGVLLKYQGEKEAVVIPGTVKKLGEGACKNTDITSVSIPAGVTEIGAAAFSGCEELTSVTIPAGVTKIGSLAFAYCASLESITFPEGLQELGEYSIGQCKKLTTVTLPASLTAIADSAFYDDMAITDVYYGGSESMWNKIAIGDHNYYMESATRHYALSDEAVKASEEARADAKKVVGEAGMITAEAGYPVGAVSAVRKAKEELNRLLADSSAKPEDIKKATEKLQEAIQAAYKAKDAVNYNINETKKTAAYTGKSVSSATVTIPATVKVGKTSYKVTEVAPGALKGNKTITKVVIGSNVKKIGKDAFRGCTKLKSVTIGKNVTGIGASVFYGCKALKKITIPAKTKNIGKSAFQGCKKLKTITIKSSKLKSVGKNALKGIQKKAKIKVPKKQLKKYKKLFKASTGFKKTMTISK